jgi:hypothetical protein
MQAALYGELHVNHRREPPPTTSSCIVLHWGLIAELKGPRVSTEASELVSIPRAELDALKAELKRLRREVGRGVAKGYIQADPGPGNDAPTYTREELAEAWGTCE